MTSWLRALGLRLAVLCTLLGTLTAAHATHAAAAKPLPMALLDSFDQAFALVYEAAERKVCALEAQAPPPLVLPDARAMLVELARQVAAMCDTASAALEVELAVSGSLSIERRAAALGCLERHLRDARRAVAQASDPEVRAEYEATCERLRDVRQRM